MDAGLRSKITGCRQSCDLCLLCHLLAGCVWRVLCSLAAPSEALGTLDTLCKIFRLDLNEQDAAERDAMLYLVAREGLQYPELSDLIYDTGIIRSREELIEWLDEQKSQGTIAIDNVTDCAGLMMDVVFGAMLPRRRAKEKVDRNWQSQMIRGRLAIILKGLGLKEPGV